MSELTERVSYLEGLVRGIDLNDRDAQSRVFHGIVSVLGDMAREVADLSDGQERLASYLGDMDEDLMDLEDSVYSEAGYACTVCGQEIPVEEGEVLELTCPECGETTWEPDERLDMGVGDRDQPTAHSSVPGEDGPH